jgi:hypothetical protein
MSAGSVEQRAEGILPEGLPQISAAESGTPCPRRDCLNYSLGLVKCNQAPEGCGCYTTEQDTFH